MLRILEIFFSKCNFVCNIRYTSIVDSANQSQFQAIIPNENGQLQLKKFSFATKLDLFPKKVVKSLLFKKHEQTQKKETNNLDFFEA